MCWWGLCSDELKLVSEDFFPIHFSFSFLFFSPFILIPITPLTLVLLNISVSCLRFPHHGTYNQWGARLEEANRSYDKRGRLTWNEWLGPRSSPDGYRPRL